MRSEELEAFLDRNGIYETLRVMGFSSRESVYKIIREKKRHIRIIQEGNFYYVRESKLLNKVKVKG